MFHSRDITFLRRYEIHRLQNMWRHHRHWHIMEVPLMAIFFNPKHYGNENWSNTAMLYGKHFQHVFGSILETGTSSRPFYDFIKMII